MGSKTNLPSSPCPARVVRAPVKVAPLTWEPSRLRSEKLDGVAPKIWKSPEEHLGKNMENPLEMKVYSWEYDRKVWRTHI